MTIPRQRRMEATEAELIDSSEGVSVAVFDGGGDRPLLLVAHATGFHGLAYRPMLEALTDFRVVTADLRGHGDAVAPPDLDYRWEGFTDDLEAILDHLAPEEPIFGFGHSMGAACLLMVEQRRPGTFRHLFCYEPIVYPPGAIEETERLDLWVERTRRRRATFPSRQEAIENYRSKAPYSTFDPRALEAYVEHGFEEGEDGSIHLRCRPETEAQIYLMGPHHRTLGALDEIACPVVVARGGDVQPGAGEWAEGIAELIPSGRLLTLEGIGHLGPFEDPEAVAAAVLEAFRAGSD